MMLATYPIVHIWVYDFVNFFRLFLHFLQSSQNPSPPPKLIGFCFGSVFVCGPEIANEIDVDAAATAKASSSVPDAPTGRSRHHHRHHRRPSSVRTTFDGARARWVSDA